MIQRRHKLTRIQAVMRTCDKLATRLAPSLRQVRHVKIEWEYDLVEKPFCEQLKLMGWQWREGDTDVPYLTERESFREVLLKARLEGVARVRHCYLDDLTDLKGRAVFSEPR